MKKYIILLLAALTLSFTAAPLATMAQGEPGTEIVQPPADDTSGAITEPPVTDDPGEITTPPPDDFVLPDVPWGLDPHAYYMNLAVFFALIVAVTQLLKKLLKKEDNQALLINIIATAVLAAIGYFFKLGALAGAPWWVPVTWFVLGLLGSYLGYGVATKIGELIGVVKKK